MKKNVIYIVEGGIGHNFNVSLSLKKYKEKYPDHNLIVLSPWPDVFYKNPDIDELYHPDDALAKEALNKRIKGDYIQLNPSVYRERLQTREEYKNKHIKEILCDVIGLEANRDDLLYYYPTDEELKEAYQFKEEVKSTGKKLGICQLEGSGIGQNPMAILKKIPENIVKGVLSQTSDKVYWVQIGVKQTDQTGKTTFEEVLYPEASHHLQNFPYRKLFALLSVADIGFGTDSFSQHLMSGAFMIPYVLLLGRSRKESYAHPATIVIEKPDSCKTPGPNKSGNYFGCEAPTNLVNRPCTSLDCMKDFNVDEIVKEIIKAI